MRKLAILLSFLFIYNFVFATQNAQVTPTQTSQEQEVSPKVPIVQFRMFLDFNINPFYWEISRNLGGFGMNPSAMFGAVWQEKTFGLQVDMNYHSLASLETDDSKKVDGAFSIFRFTAVSYIPLTKFMEIKVSAGGAFMSTAVRYKADRNIQQLYGGPSVGFDMFLRFKKLDFAELQFINRFDLMIAESQNVYPYYYGGARINFFPYVKWIKLYAEVGVMPWFYKDEQVKVETAMFTWSIGASFDATFMSSFKKTVKANPRAKLEKAAKSEMVKLPAIQRIKEKPEAWIEEGSVPQMASLPETKELPPLPKMDKKTRLRYIEIIEELEEYYGDARVLSFRNVLFKPNTSELVDKKQEKILQEVAQLLLQYDNIFINICGYTNDTGEDELERILSQERAEFVVKYMEEQGIPLAKMTLAGRGSAGLKTKAIDDINRRVELRILMKIDEEDYE
jgi:outer membrane protein OmpA-like peptidoglycan-associated protein